MSRRQIWMDPTAPEKQGFPTTSPARQLTDLRVPTHVLSPHSPWSSRLKPSFCRWQASRLTGPIYQHVIGMFNTYSWGPTHRFLTDTCKGYNLGGVGFPHTPPQPSQWTVSTFYLRAPPGLRLSKIYQRFQGSSLGTHGRHVVFWSLGHLS
jgi:hypothetical protein